MKYVALTKKLRKLGFSLVRQGGNHEIWGKADLNVAVPRHREINEITAKAILKQAGGKK